MCRALLKLCVISMLTNCIQKTCENKKNYTCSTITCFSHPSHLGLEKSEDVDGPGWLVVLVSQDKIKTVPEPTL